MGSSCCSALANVAAEHTKCRWRWWRRRRQHRRAAAAAAAASSEHSKRQTSQASKQPQPASHRQCQQQPQRQRQSYTNTNKRRFVVVVVVTIDIDVVGHRDLALQAQSHQAPTDPEHWHGQTNECSIPIPIPFPMMMMLLTGSTGAADRNNDGNGYRVGEIAAAGNERHNVWLGLGVGVSVSSSSSPPSSSSSALAQSNGASSSSSSRLMRHILLLVSYLTSLFLSIFSSFWSAKQTWVKLLSWRQWCYRLHSDTHRQTSTRTCTQTQQRQSNCCCCCSARVKWMTHQQHPRVWQVAGRLLRLRAHKGNGSKHCVYNGFVIWRNDMEEGEGGGQPISSSRYKLNPPRQMGTESITWCVCACLHVHVCVFVLSLLLDPLLLSIYSPWYLRSFVF